MHVYVCMCVCVKLLSFSQELAMITRYFIFICDSSARDVFLGVLYGYKGVLQVRGRGWCGKTEVATFNTNSMTVFLDSKTGCDSGASLLHTEGQNKRVK